ncbi:MAG: flagellar filament capping protein FliD [Bdellovibrionales bacterium]|nr:flagellar filament capping protein FliD [Bdellovibrionales bacterium]
MGLRFDPMGGGQFQAAIKQIIEAERQPVKQLEKRKGFEEQKLKLFQDFKSKFAGFEKTLAEFENFKKFRELKVDLGEGAGIVGVTVDKERAEPGVYNLTVEQMAVRGSIMSNSFEKPDEATLGAGYIVVSTPDGGTQDVYIESENSSLRGIAQKINSDRNLPIRASVVQDLTDESKPWRLVIASKDEALGKRVDFPEFYFMNGYDDIYIDEEKEAANGVISVDGFPIQTESNQIKDFMTGVNLQLKQAKPDQVVTVSITEDYQKVSGKVKGLVDQINGILEFINKQNQVDDKTDTKSTFAGDTSLQSIEYRIRNLLHEGFYVRDKKSGENRLIFLNQVGIQFEKNGLLAFKENVFQKSLETDFDGISTAITGEYGFASQIKQVIGMYTRPGSGTLAMRESGLRERIKRIDDQIEQKERRIEQKQKSLTEQFSRLQGTLANMQKQQQYLAANLPGGGGGGNMVAQLLGG